MGDAGHRQLDHTADLAFELWAADESSLLAEAMRAVVGEMTEGARLDPGQTREIELEAIDPPDRLVRWLNEIIYLGVTESFFPCQAAVSLQDDGLRAVLRGQTDPALLRNEIKSATYHDLQLRHEAERVTATVVLDV